MNCLPLFLMIKFFNIFATKLMNILNSIKTIFKIRIIISQGIISGNN